MISLKDYLEQADETQTAFAARCGTTVPTISRIVAGALTPGLELAHTIERETGGKVPTETWVKMRADESARPFPKASGGSRSDAAEAA